MTRRVAAAAVGLALAGLAPACDGCRREAPPSASADAGHDALASGPVDAGARALDCDPGVVVHSPGPGAVVGEGVARDAAAWVGVVAPRDGRPTHRAVRVGSAPGGGPVVELGTAFGDEPPPQPIFTASGPVAVHYASSPGARRMAVTSLGDAKATLATIDVQSDESYAFSAAARESVILVAWDEDRKPADTGVIKVARVGGGQPDAGANARGVSAAGSDAESPRLVAGKEGFWLAWLARKPEVAADAAVDAPEGPGERRAYQWVEIVLLGDDGAPIGEVRRVTPQAGHVAQVELVAEATGVSAYVVDEDARADGAGMRIDRVRVTKDKIEPAVEVVASGVGRSSVQALELGSGAGGDTWLAFADLAERGQAAIVGAGPARLVAPSAFAAGRPVVRLGDGFIVLGFKEGDRGDAVLRFSRCKDATPH